MGQHTFSQNLKTALREKGMTQTMLATLIGVNQSAVSDYVNGSVPMGDRLVAIARALDTTAERLLGVEKPGIREHLAKHGGDAGALLRRAMSAEAALPKDGEPAKPYLPPVESMTLEAQAIEASTIWRMFEGLTPEAKPAAFRRLVNLWVNWRSRQDSSFRHLK